MIGDPEYYKVCKAMFICDAPYATTAGFADKYEGNFAKAKELLKEGGYDGTPVVLMHSTDLYVLTNLAPVAKALMERTGMKVDMQSMDWQTLVSRRARRTRPTKAAGTPSSPRRPRSTSSIRWPTTSSTRSARRPGSAGRATTRSPSCATPSPTRPTRPSARRSSRRSSCAPPRTRRTPSSASTTRRWRCARTSPAALVSPVTVFWNIEKK